MTFIGLSSASSLPMVLGMGILASLQPRDRAEARRTVLLLTAVAALVTVVLAVVNPKSAGGLVTAFALVLPAATAIVVAAWLLTRCSGEARVVWAVFPLAAIGAIATLDVVTDDASIAAFVFLFFPVLYAGFQLPRLGAFIVIGAGVIAVAVVSLRLLPLEQAATAVVSLPAFLIASGGVLVYTNERRATLMERLRQQAAVDPLTGLATRRVLDQSANSALCSAAHGEGTALILIDVDNFKTVNDRWGHLVGDEVLVRVAELLTGAVEREAVVSRMGGDELAVLLPGSTLADACALGERVCSAVRAYSFAPDSDAPELLITLSIGVAHAPTQADDLRSLYAIADAALYQAKRSGRDQVTVLSALPVTLEPSRSGGRRLGPADVARSA